MKTFKTFFCIVALLIVRSSLHAQLPALTEAINANSYKNIHSVIIAQNGNTIYEKYFNGFGADSLHDSRSSFKSVASLLVGIAIDKGLIKNANQPVYTFFPQDSSFAADPLKRKITIKDLLQMRSGFDCDEWMDEKDCESEMEQTNNWVKFSLGLRMKDTPGTVWAYTSCDPMIISGIISHASGMSLMGFAAKYLFKPMGIHRYKWTVDPSGNGMTGGSFYILPTDMLKLGEMVLNKGKWDGKRIVSEKWLKESTTANIPIPGNWSFMKYSGSKIGIPQQTYYGYYWYNEVMKTKEWQYEMLFASGNGGQYIMNIKELNLVVVFTQGNYGSGTAKQAFDILSKYIIPACRQSIIVNPFKELK